MENCDMLMHLSDDVRKVFEACLPVLQRDAVKLQELGKLLTRPQELGKLLTRPPLFTTIRINFLKEPKELIKCKLQEAINQQFSAICSEAAPTVIEHNNLEDVLLIPSHGPLSPPRLPVEVVVDSLCGCAVLRGAHVFAQGIIGAPASLQAGDQVSVYADLDARCKKGLLQPYQGRTHFVGNGIAQFSRADLFKSPTPPSGIGVLMNAPHFWSPSLSDLLPDLIYAQNLPSALTSHVLNPLPGQLVIDMCSAPGGKTTHIATLMKNQGRVVALDKSSRIKRVRDTARAWNLNSIETYSYDATKACRDESDVDGEPPYPAGCFDRVLVDAPCSALGQRPCLRRTDDDKQLSSHSKCQRSILQTAVRLLKPDGMLVYSTCTIRPEECEQQVAWVLQKYPDLQLVPQNPVLGRPGHICAGLSAEQAQLLQRFYPFSEQPSTCISAGGTTYISKLIQNCNSDTIGFFIAKFQKSIPQT